MKPHFSSHERPKPTEAQGSGLGFMILKPKPKKARPFSRLPGQPKPGNHYLRKFHGFLHQKEWLNAKQTSLKEYF